MDGQVEPDGQMELDRWTRAHRFNSPSATEYDKRKDAHRAVILSHLAPQIQHKMWQVTDALSECECPNKCASGTDHASALNIP